MDSHQIREENSILRDRVIKAETKLKLVADVLEKRNTQLEQCSQSYKDLRNQFIRAQDACNSQAQKIKDRDLLIEQLKRDIQQLKCEKIQQNYNKIQTEADLEKKLYQIEVEFKEQLTQSLVMFEHQL